MRPATRGRERGEHHERTWPDGQRRRDDLDDRRPHNHRGPSRLRRSPFCDITLPNTCPGQGQECVAWYDPGEAPPGYDNIGACVLPTP